MPIFFRFRIGRNACNGGISDTGDASSNNGPDGTNGDTGNNAITPLPRQAPTKRTPVTDGVRPKTLEEQQQIWEEEEYYPSEWLGEYHCFHDLPRSERKYKVLPDSDDDESGDEQ